MFFAMLLQLYADVLSSRLNAVHLALDCAPLLGWKWTVADIHNAFLNTHLRLCIAAGVHFSIVPLPPAHRRPLCARCPLNPDLRLFPYICFRFDLTGVTLNQRMLSTFSSHSGALMTSTSDLNPSHCTVLSGHSFYISRSPCAFITVTPFTPIVQIRL